MRRKLDAIISSDAIVFQAWLERDNEDDDLVGQGIIIGLGRPIRVNVSDIAAFDSQQFVD